MSVDLMRRPVFLWVVVTLVATVAAFGLVAHYGAGSVNASVNLQTVPDPTPDPTIPRGERAESPPDVALPLNSTLNDPGETVSVTTSWGTLGAEPVALQAATSQPDLPAPPAQSSRGRRASDAWAGTENCQNVPGLPGPTSHQGKVKVRWKMDSFDAVPNQPRSVISYRIERRFYFPEDYGPSDYQLVVEAHPHNSRSDWQVYVDSDVASRSMYEYLITPLLDNGTVETPQEFRVKSSTASVLEGYGVADGIQLHVRYNVDDPPASHKGLLKRLRRDCDGGLSIGSNMNIFSQVPAPKKVDHLDRWPRDVQQVAYYASVFGDLRPGVSVYSHSPVVHIEATHELPSEPRQVSLSGEVGGKVSVSWKVPEAREFQVAQYEVLRRQVFPAVGDDWNVIATNRGSSYEDTTTVEGVHYEYKLRSVTKQGARGPESEVVGYPTFGRANCVTHHGNEKEITHVFVDYDVFNEDGVVEDIGALDVWGYATTPSGDLERCKALDVDRLEVTREIYFSHAIDDGCADSGTSCDVIVESAGNGQVAVVNESFFWVKAGWPRHLFARIYLNDIAGEPGVYQMRYRACAMHSGSSKVCSQWRDSGTVNWRVPGLEYTSADVEAIPDLLPPRYSFY